MKILKLLCVIAILAMSCGQMNALVCDSIKSSDCTTKKILFLGDSISVGIGASDGTKRYTTLTTKALNKEKDKYEEFNVAISGSTLIDQPWPAPYSSGYPYILSKAIDEKPDIFVIQHGTNDNAIGASLGQFLWSYRQTVRTIKEKLPQTKIVCMTICPSWKIASAREDWLNQANIGIQEIAAFENTLLAHTNFKLKNRKELFPDGIHPNDEGHKIMSESVIEALMENNLKSKDKFDFICNGFGQYRICGYVFDIKAKDSNRKDGWVCFYNVQKKGFSYKSDYNIEVASPFKLYDKDFTTELTSGKLKNVRVESYRDNYNCRGFFSMPKTNEQKITVQVIKESIADGNLQ